MRERSVLPAQPEPLQALVVHFPGKGPSGISTSIARTWNEGDSGPNGRCRLCDQCGARKGSCLVVVDQHVPLEDAEMFSMKEHRAKTGSRGFRMYPGLPPEIDGLTILAPGETEAEGLAFCQRKLFRKIVRLHASDPQYVHDPKEVQVGPQERS